MGTVDHFRGGTLGARTKLNRMVDELNALGKIRGDDLFIVVRRTANGGLVVGLNIGQVIARIPHLGGGGSTQSKVVQITSVGTSTLQCKDLDDSGGMIGAAFTVYCQSFGNGAQGTATIALCTPCPSVGEQIRVIRTSMKVGTSFVPGWFWDQRIEVAQVCT